jgi:hypothetical protein
MQVVYLQDMPIKVHTIYSRTLIVRGYSLIFFYVQFILGSLNQLNIGSIADVANTFGGYLLFWTQDVFSVRKEKGFMFA